MFRRRLGMSAGGAGFRPSHVRWYVFRRRRGTSPSPTGGGVAAGGGGSAPALQGAVVVVSLAVGDECRRCWVPALHVRWSVFRRRRGTSPSPTGGGVAAGGAGFPPSHVRWYVVRRRRGTSPSPTGGGVAAGGAGFRPSHVRWSVFCRRRGTSPSPTLGRWRCRRPVGDEGRRCRGRWLLFRWRLGMSAGGAGFPPSTSGGRCFAGGGGQAPALH